MRQKLIRCLSLAITVAVVCLGTGAIASNNQTLNSRQVSERVSLIAVADLKIHTFHGVSNSHIIETPNELRLIDAQMMLTDAKELKGYISSLGKPLKQVILSHNHPDHWFGAEVFAADTPIVTSQNIADDLKSGGMRYIKVMQKKLKDNMPDKVIVPSGEITTGKHNWDGVDVIVEEYPEQESHNSLVIKVPAYGIMIGQDLFYNGNFLVASERSRNKTWQQNLESFQANEAKFYKTFLVGHGKNGGPEILTQDIEYLKTLEVIMGKGLSQEETTKMLIETFPHKDGRKMLAISMRNLFNAH